MPVEVSVTKKIAMLGDPAVGKTSMIRKFVYNDFDDKYISTLGTKVTKKEIEYDNLQDGKIFKMNLMIWDVMGQNEYKIFHKSAFAGSEGAIIVCDVTRGDTIRNCSTWKSDLFKMTREIPIIIIGNKNDLPNQCETEIKELNKEAKDSEIPFYFTSAKTGENVEKIFTVLGEYLLKEGKHLS